MIHNDPLALALHLAKDSLLITSLKKGMKSGVPRRMSAWNLARTRVVPLRAVMP